MIGVGCEGLETGESRGLIWVILGRKVADPSQTLLCCRSKKEEEEENKRLAFMASLYFMAWISVELTATRLTMTLYVGDNRLGKDNR